MCLFFRKIGILIGWILFIAVAYKASQVEIDFTEFDPYKELGIDRVSLSNLSSRPNLTIAKKKSQANVTIEENISLEFKSNDLKVLINS